MNAQSPALDPLEDVVEAIGNGSPIVLLADDGEQFEGYLMSAARAASPEVLSHMLAVGGGLVYVPMTGRRLDELGLPDMVPDQADTALSAATVSVDLQRPAARGISISDRSECIRRLADRTSQREDFRSPGHVHPVRARARGLLDRRGVAEAATDLVGMAGLEPVAVTCKILSDDGSDAGRAAVHTLAQASGFPTTSISAILAHRRSHEALVRLLGEADMPTAFGRFSLKLFASEMDDKQHVAMVLGDVRGKSDVLVRIQRECVLGDVFRSLYCECRPRLEASMRRIAAEGSGVVVYLRGAEWRLDLMHKVDSRDPLMQPPSPSPSHGSEADSVRDYGPAAQILTDLGLTSVRLLSNRSSESSEPPGLRHGKLRVAGWSHIDPPE